MGAAAFLGGILITGLFLAKTWKTRVFIVVMVLGAVGLLYWQQGAILFMPTGRLDMWKNIFLVMTKTDTLHMMHGFGEGSYAGAAYLVYKKAWDNERIFKFFKEERGKHFDPALIDIFFEHQVEFLSIRDRFKDD